MKEKKSPLIRIALVILLCGGMYLVIRSQEAKEQTLERLYQQAVEDARIAEIDEICPLVEITKDSDLVTWNDKKDKVLLATFHKYPDSYPEEETVTIEWGEVWTFSEREMEVWYQDYGKEVDDWNLRLSQLLGMPADSGNTYVTAMWVSPEEVVRPAYCTDITAQMNASFLEGNSEHDPENTYPWTGLGYTYDWADNDTEYGLTEFKIQKGAEVEVLFTVPVDEYKMQIEE